MVCVIGSGNIHIDLNLERKSFELKQGVQIYIPVNQKTILEGEKDSKFVVIASPSAK